jgi:hypothetical protein
MIRASFAAAVAVAASAWISFGQPGFGQEETDQRLGTVHFATSCNETAQRRFDRGIRYQHSFWYRESKEIFEDVLKADPKCAIAYWGIAISLLNNPFIGAPPVSNLPAAVAALEKGTAIGAKTPRERDYIAALTVLFADYDKIAHRTRVQAYLKAMEELSQRYPSDDEAQLFYALALNVAASPDDKTYADQLKAAAILEQIFKRQPYHPGVAHYLIHTYDYPAIADKGLGAAARYTEIAPGAPHALHMPSHIFTRVGLWKESIASNNASVRAAKAGKEPHDQLHGMDYLVYAYLQFGQDKEARKVVDEMLELKGFNPEVRTGWYAQAASDARYVIERSDWKGAAELQVRPSRFGYAGALTHFARALGAARSGNPDVAKQDIAKLVELREKLRQANDGYWTEQVDIQWQIATAWVLFAEAKYDGALKAMSMAADAEDKTEKSVVTPGQLLPARELFAAMLLERGMAKEALAGFEATLKNEPHRLGATLGAAKAAEEAGDTAKARQHYLAVVTLTENADPVRPQIEAARASVAKK